MSLKDNISDYFRINELRDNVAHLIEAKIELVKIDFQEKIEDIIVKVIYAAVLAFISLLVLIFLSILLAGFLNNWLKSQYLGFLIVGSFYAILLLIWIFAKNAVTHQIKNIAEKVTDSQMNKK